jgi:hypothetical protein
MKTRLAAAVLLVLCIGAPRAHAQCSQCLVGSVSGSGLDDPLRFHWEGLFSGVIVQGRSVNRVAYDFEADGSYDREAPYLGTGTMTLRAATGEVAFTLPLRVARTDAGWVFLEGMTPAGSYLGAPGEGFSGVLAH